jgi:hypothetical protein
MANRGTLIESVVKRQLASAQVLLLGKVSWEGCRVTMIKVEEVH